MGYILHPPVTGVHGLQGVTQVYSCIRKELGMYLLCVFSVYVVMPCYLGLERFKSSECLESALAALCRQISRPAAMFDKFEVIDLLNSLARPARSERHQKVEE